MPRSRPLDAEELYGQEVRHFPNLNPEERRTMVQDVSGITERNRFAEHNLRLVIKIAQSFWRRCYNRTSGIDFLDLVQAGNVCLLEAIRRFDPQRGFTFANYASWWIRRGIIDTLSLQGRSIVIARNRMNALLKFERQRRTLEENLHRAPTIEELMPVTNLSAAQIEALLEDFKLMFIQSLDEPNDSHDSDSSSHLSTLGDLIPNTSEADPLQQLLAKEAIQERLNRNEQARKYLATQISTREMEIYTLRCPPDHDDALTLAAIGKKFNLTRERIRQIEEKAKEIIRTYLKSLNEN